MSLIFSTTYNGSENPHNTGRSCKQGKNRYLLYFWFHTSSIQHNKMVVDVYANFISLEQHNLTNELVYRSTRTRQAKLFVLLVLMLVMCASSLPHAYAHAYVVGVLTNAMTALVLMSY